MDSDTLVEQYIYGLRPGDERSTQKELARSAGVNNVLKSVVTNFAAVFDDIPPERFETAKSIMQCVYDHSGNLIVLRAWDVVAEGRTGKLIKSLILPRHAYTASTDPIALAFTLDPEIPAERHLKQLDISELLEQARPFLPDYAATLEHEFAKYIVRTALEQKTLAEDVPVVLEVDFDPKLLPYVAGLLYFSLPQPNRRKGFITLYGVKEHKLFCANKDKEKRNRQFVCDRLKRYDFVFICKGDYRNLWSSILPRISPNDADESKQWQERIRSSFDVLFKQSRSSVLLWSILSRIGASKKRLSQMCLETFEKHFLWFALHNNDFATARDIVQDYAAARKPMIHLLDGILREIVQIEERTGQAPTTTVSDTILSQIGTQSVQDSALEPYLWDVYFGIAPQHPKENLILETIRRISGVL